MTSTRWPSVLAKAGLLGVDSEERVRGAVERTYRLYPARTALDLETIAAMTIDDHQRGFAAAIAALLAEFDVYLEREGADPSPTWCLTGSSRSGLATKRSQHSSMNSPSPSAPSCRTVPLPSADDTCSARSFSPHTPPQALPRNPEPRGGPDRHQVRAMTPLTVLGMRDSSIDRALWRPTYRVTVTIRDWNVRHLSPVTGPQTSGHRNSRLTTPGVARHGTSGLRIVR